MQTASECFGSIHLSKLFLLSQSSQLNAFSLRYKLLKAPFIMLSRPSISSLASETE